MQVWESATCLLWEYTRRQVICGQTVSPTLMEGNRSLVQFKFIIPTQLKLTEEVSYGDVMVLLFRVE